MKIEEKIDKLFSNLEKGYCLLLCGYSGLGKTYQGLRVGGKDTQIVNSLTSWTWEGRKREILFFDEAQMLPKKSQENLLGYIDKGISYPCEEMKIILATTDPSRIISPILERAYRVDFDFYDPDEMKEILNRHNVTSHQEEIISLCKGSPREALKIGRVLMKEGYENTLQLLGLHPDGLTDVDIRYMKLLQIPRSLSVISGVLGIIPLDISQNIEPYLIKQGYVNITSKGRMLTLKGKNYLAKNCLSNEEFFTI